MKERPIIFDAESVRAILDGRKTQTRRVVKRKQTSKVLPDYYPGEQWWVGAHPNGGWWAVDIPGGPPGSVRKDTQTLGRQGFPCPFGQPGDRLWVRETFSGEKRMVLGRGHLFYRADGEHHGYQMGVSYREREDRWRSPIYMPRWASRITLEVTDVRVEMLGEIKFPDVIAEGVPASDTAACVLKGGNTLGAAAVEAFSERWDALNAKRGYSWESNPWVWVVSLRRVEESETEVSDV